MVLTEQYDFSWGQVPVSDPRIMRHNILQYCLKLLLSKDWKTSTKAVSDSPIFGPYKVQSGLQSKPRRVCNPCGYTMKMNSRYHRLLIYDV